MKKNSLHEVALIRNSAGLSKVTRKLTRERAVKLASSHGRPAQDVSKSDWERAKRQLQGEPDVEPIAVGSDGAAERERWNPLSGSTGYKVHVPSGDDEDDEGRSDTERLVEGGVRHAGRDQMFEAARAAENNE